MSTAPFGQVLSQLPARDAGATARAVISAGRDIELDARSMLILADGLFRLDVVPRPDTIQTIVRSLSSEMPHAELRSAGEVGGESRASGIAPQPSGRFRGEIFLIGAGGEERAVARLLVSSICHLERGLTSFTAQAELL